MYLAFSKNYGVSAYLDEARSCGAFLAAVSGAVNINVAADFGRSVHLFSLNEAAVVAIFNESVEITVVGQSSVGGARCSFLVNVVKRSEVSHMACLTLRTASVQSEGVDTYNLISFRKLGKCREVRRDSIQSLKRCNRHHYIRKSC